MLVAPYYRDQIVHLHPLYIFKCNQNETRIEWDKKDRRTWFINFTKVLGAFESPNDMTNHANNSSFVLKVVYVHP
jgi:hypothetical protein